MSNIDVNDLFYDGRGGIKTQAKDFPVLVQVTGKSGEQKDKATPEGEAQYKVKGNVLQLNRDGDVGTAFQTYVSTKEPLHASNKIGQANLYKAEGEILYRSFASGDNPLVTLTIDRLVALSEAEVQAIQDYQEDGEEDDADQPVEAEQELNF